MTVDAPEEGGWLAIACRGLERIAMLLLGVMTAFIVIQVTGRNVFDAGLPWAEELARYAGLGVVFLAVPLLLLRDRHVKVDMLLSRARGPAARVLHVVNELVILAFCLLFLWGGWRFLARASQFSTAALGIPNWLYYLPAAIGMVMFSVVSLRRLARVARGGPPS
jgi:TRAP-type transport system small permease protein